MVSRIILIVSFISFITPTRGQKVISAGVFTGITIPFTIDQGIDADARYQKKYDIKFAPIGFHCGIDFEDSGIGIFASPSIMKVGQNFFIVNTVGGQSGERKIDATYAQLPLSFKAHIIDLAFFRLSFVTSAGVGVLLEGQETIKHARSKLVFPDAALPHLPSDYDVEYDGVIVPDIANLEIQSSENYSSIQLFGALGFRADWDVSDHWRVSIDLRGNYGVLETRTNEYLDNLKTNGALYDIYGKRRDVFVSLNIGLSRTLQLDKKESKFKRMKFKRNNRRPRN